ncbi:MAG: hypothetical protein HQM06_07885 [Magnetococcales bacterium]|nr:hypothetical protein [Magnetococcales bacterium]
MKQGYSALQHFCRVTGVALLATSAAYAQPIPGLSQRLSTVQPIHTVLSEPYSETADQAEIALQLDWHLAKVPTNLQQAEENQHSKAAQTTQTIVATLSAQGTSWLHAVYQDLLAAGNVLQATLDNTGQESSPSLESMLSFAPKVDPIDNALMPPAEQMGVALSYKLTPGLSADFNYRLSSAAELKLSGNELVNPGSSATFHELTAGMRLEF